MSISAYTLYPHTQLDAIKKAIDDKKIETWKYDGSGDFTHTPSQWANQAWFRPYVENNVLKFGLISNKNVSMTSTIYGVYHGRFAEMLLTHFYTEFSNISSSGKKDSIDTF